MCRFFGDVGIARFNDAADAALGGASASELGKEYTHYIYGWRLGKGIPQYPDANSTMRLTYGTVKGYSPRDGVNCHWQSTIAGLLEKEDASRYDFTLKPEWSAMLKSADRSFPVNFLTDNDITGGNSGSPVMNARGELVGLAFDGNKESLASNYSFTPDYNRCVCVDIRFVLWTLEHYAGMSEVIKEMKIK